MYSKKGQKVTPCVDKLRFFVKNLGSILNIYTENQNCAGFG
jgi:hypothetical protein